MTAHPRLEMRGIDKAYDSTPVLRDVDFSAEAGEIHALAGENGAGKSTLIKVLAGAVHRDAGTIAIDGQNVEIATPLEARRSGIRVVYQEFSLVPHLSITENILLGQMPRSRGGPWIDWRAAEERVNETLQALDFKLPPLKTLVRRLPVSQRQMIEIAKALIDRPRIVVLDEPSAVLSAPELERLFVALKRLRASGTTVIYVSHRLNELFEIADRITVLKDGALVGTVRAADVDEPGLVRMMVGRQLKDFYQSSDAGVGPVVLTATGLGRPGVFEDVTFELRAGEIVGVFGLVGSGRTEVARSIFGADRLHTGELTLDGQTFRPRSPSDALRAGIAMVSEDRARDGLVLFQSIRDNVSLPSFRAMSRLGLISRRLQDGLVSGVLADVGVRQVGLRDPVRRLSGGNQQKVVLGKWLLRGARVLILDEPTRGVDVGAKAEIYRIVANLAGEGKAILLISSELPEVLGMADRTLVMRFGRVVGAFSRQEATEERLLAAAAGVALGEVA
jgi:ABC-type sugar transport system ATPase subunit